MTSVNNLSQANPDGTSLGQSATDKISFYGATPVVQASAITAPTSTAATSTTPVGFSTNTQADAVVSAVRSIITALKNLGATA